VGEGRTQPIWEIFYKIVIGHELLHRGATLPGLDFEEGREFRFSIVNVSLVVTKLV